MSRRSTAAPSPASAPLRELVGVAGQGSSGESGVVHQPRTSSGLCTYGIADRALVQGLSDGDTAGIVARFSLPVVPGELLTTLMGRSASTPRSSVPKRPDRGR